MGCSHSTQRRTTRRRRPKRKRKVEENVESKEMRLKRQIAPTEPVFQADLALFTAAPDKNYRSEHIDLVVRIFYRSLIHTLIIFLRDMQVYMKCIQSSLLC